MATKSKAFARWLRALKRAEAVLADHKEETIRIVVSKLSKQKAKMIRAIWDDFEAEIKLDNLLLTVLRSEAKWFREQGKFTNPVPNFTSVIFSDYLKETFMKAMEMLDHFWRVIEFPGE